VKAATAFAGWALALRIDDVPSDVIHHATRHVLDGLGCAHAAAHSGEVSYAVEVARSLGGPSEATIIGTGDRLGAAAAAFANGALIHALDFDDTHTEALVHATAAVLPAALAVGEEVDASGAATLSAIIAGYEIVARLGSVVRHGFHARGFHATSVCGVFASALIAAKLYGLSVEQTVNALGIAGSQAAGLLEFLATGSATKQLHPGFAAQSGIIAARLAAAGATGPVSIFEGEHGLFRAYLGVEVHVPSLIGSLGAQWETTRISIKPYPACQLSHASLDALATLLPLDTGAIDSIVFDVPTDSVPIVCEPQDIKRVPRTAYEGKFSLPYSAASLAVDGTLTVASFEPTALARPDVLALAQRIAYRAVDIDRAPAEAPGRAEVRLHDGSKLVGSVEVSHGGPARPMSDDELIAKFVANAGSKEPVDVIFGLADAPHVAAVLA
jgi:2-methylcitrate dehydratase PrpD